MPVSYPAVKPSRQVFEAAKWPTSKVRSQSGIKTVRLWGSKPNDATLMLEYAAISDDNAAAIIQAHYDARGTTIDLTLPSIVYAGASASFQNWLNLTAIGGGIKWYFADDTAPNPEYLSPRRRRMTVNLIAEIRLS